MDSTLHALLLAGEEETLSNISDTFAGPTLDATKWTAVLGDASSSVSIVDHAVEINHNGDINPVAAPIPITGITSVERATEGSRVNIRYVRHTTDTNNDWGMTEQHLVIQNISTDQGFGFVIDGTSGAPNLRIRAWNDFRGNWYHEPEFFTAIPYNDTDHAWLGIECKNGSLVAFTAPDNGSGQPGTWTQRATIALSVLAVNATNWNVPEFLRATRIFIGAMNWSDQFQDSWFLTNGRILAVNDSASAAATTNHTSVASAAAYSLVPAPTTNVLGRVSIGSPATYALTAQPAVSGVGLFSVASPATYTLTGVDAVSSYQAGAVAGTSVASPASFTVSASPATGQVSLNSVALAATYATSAIAASSVYSRNSAALLATYSMVPVAATSSVVRSPNTLSAVYAMVATPAVSVVNRAALALPATYTFSPVAATSVVKRNYQSAALAATYTVNPVVTRDQAVLSSSASPATYVSVPVGTTDETSANYTQPVSDAIPIRTTPDITDIQFLDWLRDETAVRVILFETQCLDADGNVERLFFGNRGFVSAPWDNIENRAYLPLIKGGLSFEARMDMELNGDQSNGDIELDNTEGDLDYLFARSFQYQPAKAFMGDARWSRKDFRQIFEGTIEDIDSSARDVLNVRLRDKLYRLDMPLHDQKVGGASSEQYKLLPVCFGECHNITPVLLDAATLKYCYHVGIGEDAHEVRDNGIPVLRSQAAGVAPATFQLSKNPAGRVTASVQGDKPTESFTTSPDQLNDPGDYTNNACRIIMRILTNWGTDPARRFTDLDIDVQNALEYEFLYGKAVGVYLTESVTVLDLCQQIAASIGARLTMTQQGKLQFTRIQLPPIGTLIEVGQSDMVEGSLQIADRILRTSRVKIGYAKNWSLQEDTALSVPEEHKKLYASEWLNVDVINEEVRTKFGLTSEPDQENTMLIRELDAGQEAWRRMGLRAEQRHVFEFEGYSDLALTPLGAPMKITHPRFGLEQGKIGQVIGISIDWVTTKVKLEVLV